MRLGHQILIQCRQVAPSVVHHLVVIVIFAFELLLLDRHRGVVLLGSHLFSFLDFCEGPIIVVSHNIFFLHSQALASGVHTLADVALDGEVERLARRAARCSRSLRCVIAALIIDSLVRLSTAVDVAVAVVLHLLLLVGRVRDRVEVYLGDLRGVVPAAHATRHHVRLYRHHVHGLNSLKLRIVIVQCLNAAHFILLLLLMVFKGALLAILNRLIGGFRDLRRAHLEIELLLIG